MSTTSIPTTQETDDVPSIELDSDSEIDLSLTTLGEFLAHPDGEEGNGRTDTEGTADTDSQQTNLLEPIALSHTTTTIYVNELHKLLQSRDFSVYNLKAVFKDEDAETEDGTPSFTSTLKIECSATGNVVKELRPHGCFPRKKLAREAVARLGIEYVKGIPGEGSCVSMGSVETENWVGLLNSFCQPSGRFPEYSSFRNSQTPPGFSYEITKIPELESMVFGDKTRFYRDIRTAKALAAKEAMLWIRANLSSVPASSQSRSGRDSVGSNDQPGIFVGRVAIAPRGSTIRVPPKGPVEKVVMICPQLGLSLPDYECTLVTQDPAIYDVTAILRRRVGRSVKIGPLKGVLGRDNAKKELAKCILRWLDNEAERNQVTIETVET